MRSEKYNGWTNRETWLVNIHFNPQSVEDLDFIKEDLEHDLDVLLGRNPFFYDFINLSKIDWRELKEAMDEPVD